MNVSELLGQPVVSLSDAENKGTVRGLRFAGNRIVTIDVGDGTTIPAASVRSFEGDAITYDPPTEPTATANLPPSDELADAAAGVDTLEVGGTDASDHPVPDLSAEDWIGDPIGKLLLTTSGNALGTLTEMHIDAHGTVVEIANDSGNSYSGDLLVTVGSYAAILDEVDEQPD